MSTNRLAPTHRFAVALGTCVLSSFTAASAHAQDAPDVGQIAELIRWGGVAASIPVIVCALLVIRIIDNIGDGLANRFSNRRPVIQQVQATTRFFVYLGALALITSLAVRLDRTTLTVIGGTVAVAVGFALRDLVASFIAGITIMFDRAFQVGDRVTYGGEYGDILNIGLRSVRLSTLDHRIVTIPNNKIFTDPASSSSYGALEMQVAMDFYVGLDQDAKRAAEIIREACLTSPYVFLDQPVPVLAKQVITQDYVAVLLKARPYVFDFKYEEAFYTDVHLRVLESFRQHNIKPPAVLHRSLPTLEAS